MSNSNEATERIGTFITEVVSFAVIMYFGFSLLYTDSPYSLFHSGDSSSSKYTSTDREITVESEAEACGNAHGTSEEMNALHTAYGYYANRHYSKSMIFYCLRHFDNFSKSQAQFAVKNLDVDYKQAALATAQYHKRYDNMSKDATYYQLCSKKGDRFTEAEAKYAVDWVSWNDK